MTRDEGLLISLEKEPHNWEAILEATHITPNGDKYIQFRHRPTKTTLNAIITGKNSEEEKVKDDARVKISLNRFNTNSQHTIYSSDLINLPMEHKIVKLLMYIKELAELETSTETSFPFLAHVERLD